MSNHFKLTELALTNGKCMEIALQTNDQNGLTSDSMNELKKILKDILANDTLKGAVITSYNPKFFCNGLDGETLLKSNPDELMEHVLGINVLFHDLLKFDKLLTVEVTGHAMGGGAVITVCGDFRVMLESGCRIAFSEVTAGLPLPPVFLDRIRLRANPAKFLEICMEACAYKGKEAVEAGLVDDTAPNFEELRKLTIKKMDSIFRLPQLAVRQTKFSINRSCLYRFDEFLNEVRGVFKTPGAMENLKEGMTAVKEKRRPVFKF